MIKNNTGENLLRYHWKKYRVITLDFESCNLNLAVNNLPWEVGYTVMDQGVQTQAHNRRIWWEDLNISEDAARITKFNDLDYKQTAEDPNLILKEFEEILYDKNTINITYNGLGFDVYLHQLWREKLGLEKDWTFLPRSIDVLALSRAYRMGIQPPEKWEDFFFWQWKLIGLFEDSRLRKARKLTGCSLSVMARELGVKVDETKTHSGLYDVELTWAIFEKLMWKLDLTTEHLGIK